MSENFPNNTARLSVVDALRGFALLAIVLIHNIEHYNIYFVPADMPVWLTTLDKWLFDTTFFLLAGKAYAIFSLLFGFSFYIQLRNERKRGGDFRLRFVWRLFLLFLFSQFHALFYNGDILLLYSVTGLVLVATCGLKDRTVFLIALICLIQPFEWMRIIYVWLNPDYTITGDHFMTYARLVHPVTSEGSFFEVLRSNIWHGQLYSNLWQVENGRLFQASALFLFGMLLGRREYFVKTERSIKNWKKILIYGAIASVPFFLLKTYIPRFVDNESMLIPINILFPSFFNFILMSIIVSGFTLLWFRRDGFKFQRLFVPYGRMSLTNYITQSIIGVTIYYGFGLGLYKYTGAAMAIVIGLFIFTLQLLFSRWWLARHRQGPLEYLWKKGTWIMDRKKCKYFP